MTRWIGTQPPRLTLPQAPADGAVTRKQYEDIVAAHREKKLEFAYSLGYVLEKRFYVIAPPEAKKEIDEAGVDIESVADFGCFYARFMLPISHMDTSLLRRRKILLHFFLGIGLPSLLLGYLAFRGIQNDIALLEKEPRQKNLWDVTGSGKAPRL